VTSILIIAAGPALFAACLYLYNSGSHRSCPRCGSRDTGAHLGSARGTFFNCRNCGAVFDGNGIMIEDQP
jgi:hypothetical protein